MRQGANSSGATTGGSPAPARRPRLLGAALSGAVLLAALGPGPAARAQDTASPGGQRVATAPAVVLPGGPAVTALRRAGRHAAPAATRVPQELRVVATLTVYGDIARQIVGERGTVDTIAAARQDAHFVQAKPSYSILLGRADLLVGTGLDLELWLPAVIDKSRNPDIREGEIGYVSVATGVPMLEVPDNPSRAGGDIHLFGNPHIHTDPLRAVIIAENIATGLKNVDPDGAGYYDERLAEFERRVHESLFGAELVGLVGGDKLAELELQHRLRPFLEDNELGGEPLMSRLGGWLASADCLRDRKIVAYHLNWIYFTDRFGIDIVDYVERRPGIPPSAAHVADLVGLMRREEIRALWVANYFDEEIPRLIAERTGATFLYVPLYSEEGGAGDYLGMVQSWIDTLKTAFPGCASSAPAP